MNGYSRIVSELKSIVGDDYVVDLPEDLIVFEYDGSVDKALPSAVVLPATTGEVSAVVRAAHRSGVPIVARGAGTGLSGGAVADAGVVLALTRMTKILEVDPGNRIAVAEAGVVNIDLTPPARRLARSAATSPRTRAALTAWPTA